MKLAIAVAEKDRKAVGKILDRLLADEYVLSTKTRNFHWNVTGARFNELHKFFEQQYGELDGIADEVAERARALGLKSMGTLREFLRHAALEEHPARLPNADGMLADLLGDHEEVVRGLRRGLAACERHGDMGTNDFLTGLMERHEKMAWMLRSYLEGGEKRPAAARG